MFQSTQYVQSQSILNFTELVNRFYRDATPLRSLSAQFRYHWDPYLHNSDTIGILIRFYTIQIALESLSAQFEYYWNPYLHKLDNIGILTIGIFICTSQIPLESLSAQVRYHWNPYLYKSKIPNGTGHCITKKICGKNGFTTRKRCFLNCTDNEICVSFSVKPSILQNQEIAVNLLFHFLRQFRFQLCGSGSLLLRITARVIFTTLLFRHFA